MITERGSGTGADGIDVMPAPSRCDVVRVVARRRVGRVEPARAEPIGELDSRDALLVRVLPVRALPVRVLPVRVLPVRALGPLGDASR
jgi:hypothetical protein